MSQNHFDRLTAESKRILSSAQNIAKDLGTSVGTEHILLSLVSFSGSFASDILRGHGVSSEKVHLVLSFAKFREKTIKGDITDEAKKLIEKAFVQAAKQKTASVTPEYLLFAITTLPNCAAYQVLEEIGIDIEQVQKQILAVISQKDEEPRPDLQDEIEELTDDFLFKGLQPGRFMMPGLGLEPPKTQKSLDTFTVDLTKKAQQAKLDPIIGREREIARVIQILNRRTKNNPVLIGEPGVGKTAIVEGLAQKIIEGKVPEKLIGKKILGLDLALMIAGTKYRGEFEERIKKVLEEIVKNKNVILFLDELHTIVGAGAAEGAMDAANILKPALARGDIRLIGATTADDYRKYVEKDAALERRLQGVKVDEPSIEDTIEILKGLRERYERHHQVKITDEAIVAAATLSKRFISDRYLPDKAVDLLDEASSMVSLSAQKGQNWSQELKKELVAKERAKEEAVENEDFELAGKIKADQAKLMARINQGNKINQVSQAQVSKNHIAKVVSDWTGIPLDNLIRDERKRFIDLEKILARRIIGQEEAIKAIAQSIRRTRTGVISPKRPLGSFIFMGPTGVGKTELAKVLAEEVFESEDALVKIDMSEFMERHNVSRLIGAPPGYVGYEEAGKLTEAVRKRPYSVVLLDEIEKAHPEVQNILLQILEDGYLTDARGRKVNFRNTIIIMTSNIGMRELSQEAAIGFKQTKKDKSDFVQHYEQMKEKILKSMKEYFRPEFLNRVDKVIVFKPLDTQAILKIVVLQLAELQARLTEPKVELKATDDAKKLIAEKGFDPENGARPIRRAISDLVEDPLAQMILDGEIKDGDRVKISNKDGKVELEKI